MQNATAIATIVVSLVIPLGSFIISTNATANRALAQSQSVEDRLTRMEDKIDKLIEKSK